jgi:hypothetical protein
MSQTVLIAGCKVSPSVCFRREQRFRCGHVDDVPAAVRDAWSYCPVCCQSKQTDDRVPIAGYDARARTLHGLRLFCSENDREAVFLGLGVSENDLGQHDVGYVRTADAAALVAAARPRLEEVLARLGGAAALATFGLWAVEAED